MSRASRSAGLQSSSRANAGKIASMVALATISIGLASCGSSSASPASNQVPTTTSVSPKARAAYQSCLAAHGFTFPKFNPNSKNPPTTVPASVRNAAVAACAKLSPNGVGGPGGPGFTLTKAQQQALAAYTACLKSHGVNIPTSGSGGPGPGGFRTQSQSPAFSSAAQACASLRPKFGGGAGAGRFSSPRSTTTTAAG